MKSKHFDTIFMDDLQGETSVDPALADKIVREMKNHVKMIEKSFGWGTSIPQPNHDYEAAKDLIREVASAQEETPSP